MTPLEINKRIAELNGHRIEFLKVRRCSGRENYDDVSWCYIDQPDGWGKPLRLQEGKNWAEDISDAWELFEELLPAEPSLLLLPDGEYMVILYDGIGNISESCSASAPKAICLAWIKWKENL